MRYLLLITIIFISCQKDCIPDLTGEGWTQMRVSEPYTLTFQTNDIVVAEKGTETFYGRYKRPSKHKLYIHLNGQEMIFADIYLHCNELYIENSKFKGYYK